MDCHIENGLRFLCFLMKIGCGLHTCILYKADQWSLKYLKCRNCLVCVGRQPGAFVVQMWNKLPASILRKSTSGRHRPSATLTGRWRPDIDLRRMLTGLAFLLYKTINSSAWWMDYTRSPYKHSKIICFLSVLIQGIIHYVSAIIMERKLITDFNHKGVYMRTFSTN